jgi:hypothetical protein
MDRLTYHSLVCIVADYDPSVPRLRRLIAS